MIFVTKEIEIAASHRLLQYVGKCHQNHGHNYKILVTVKANDSDLNEVGMVVDFGELKRILQEFIDEPFDHKNLNNVEPFSKAKEADWENDFDVFFENRKSGIVGIEKPAVLKDTKYFNPTAENMAREFYYILKKHLPNIHKLTIYETPTSYATYLETPDEFKK